MEKNWFEKILSKGGVGKGQVRGRQSRSRGASVRGRVLGPSVRGRGPSGRVLGQSVRGRVRGSSVRGRGTSDRGSISSVRGHGQSARGRGYRGHAHGERPMNDAPQLIPENIKPTRAQLSVAYSPDRDLHKFQDLIISKLEFTIPPLDIAQILQGDGDFTNKTVNIIVGVVKSDGVDPGTCVSMWERKEPILTLIDSTYLTNNNNNLKAIIHPLIAKEYGYLLIPGTALILSNTKQRSKGTLMVVPNNLAFIGTESRPNKDGHKNLVKFTNFFPLLYLLETSKSPSPHVKIKLNQNTSRKADTAAAAGNAAAAASPEFWRRL